MAWCDTCNRHVDDADLRARSDGSTQCPTCGTPVASAALSDDDTDDADEAPRAPWHFKVLVVGTIGYLVYRLIWFIGWLSHHT